MRTDKRLSVLGIAGTRPEAIKLAPIAIEASRRRAIDFRLLATGQHDDMFDDALEAFGLHADIRIAPPDTRDDPDTAIAGMVTVLEPAIAAVAPDIVLVQGDTNSAYAGAIAADRLSIPVGHVEAGLRSGDTTRPWPEERNRIGIDALSSLLFAPTAIAAAHLSREAAVTGVVTITGNTGIDALLSMRDRVEMPVPSLRHRVLLTCHRRESIGAGIEAICAAVLRLATRGDVDILCPVHRNPAVRATVEALLSNTPAITLVDPLPYPRAVAALAGARLVLTDSGGIQEEAATLGIPTLVLRDETERREGVTAGNLRVVGTDPGRIVAEAARLLDDPAAHAAMARRSFPFGAGDAAVRILDAIERHFDVPAAHERFLPLATDAIKDGARTGA